MDITVVHAQPRLLTAFARAKDKHPQVFVPGSPTVAITTWETNSMPAEYNLDDYNEVIVPSEFCAEAIVGDPESTWIDKHAHVARRLTGGRVDISVVPHCFDPAFWRDLNDVRIAGKRWPPNAEYGTAPDPTLTRFYTIGAWGERKNPMGVLRAYLHEFTRHDSVHLLLLCSGLDLSEVRSLIARSAIPTSELPRLSIPQNVSLSEQELVELHAGGDVFVSATRGEGWGLGHFEAAIMGNRVITPLYGGQADFLDEYGNCEGVPYQMTPCFGGEVRGEIMNGHQVSRVDITPGVTAKQLWADPDLGELARRMRETHMKRAYREGQLDADLQDRSLLEYKYDYKVIGNMLADTLREHIG